MYSSNLTIAQMLGTMGSAACLWGVGVIMIRRFGKYFFGNELARIGTMILNIPLSYVTIIMVEQTIGAPRQERLFVTALACATALLMDGFAMTWYPNLYEDPSLKKKNDNGAVVLTRFGAGFLLYTFGFTLFWGAFT